MCVVLGAYAQKHDANMPHIRGSVSANGRRPFVKFNEVFLISADSPALSRGTIRKRSRNLVFQRQRAEQFPYLSSQRRSDMSPADVHLSGGLSGR
jgi:hypothetical protein